MTRTHVAGGNLVAVLCNPPLTSGARTLARLDLAKEVLGYESLSVANIFGIATRSSGEITAVGASAHGWEDARIELEEALAHASAALLAYGKTEPSGAARLHHRSQVSWVIDHLVTHGTPTWLLGEYPYHPSRWQRWRYRHAPDATMREALTEGLQLARAPARQTDASVAASARK